VKLRRWTALYTQGRRYHSDSHEWRELPAEGCLAVVAFYDNGYKEALLSGDWFYLVRGRLSQTRSVWTGEPGSYAARPPLPKRATKRGVWVPDAEWAQVEAEAKRILRNG
jgi:hypothetical protein